MGNSLEGIGAQVRARARRASGKPPKSVGPLTSPTSSRFHSGKLTSLWFRYQLTSIRPRMRHEPDNVGSEPLLRLRPARRRLVDSNNSSQSCCRVFAEDPLIEERHRSRPSDDSDADRGPMASTVQLELVDSSRRRTSSRTAASDD